MANKVTKPKTREQLAEAFTALELVVLLIAVADEHYVRAQRAFDAAKERREELREQFRSFFPDGVDVDVDELGQKVRRTVARGGRTFSLTGYELLNEITPQMERHIGRRKGAETWAIEDL